MTLIKVHYSQWTILHLNSIYSNNNTLDDSKSKIVSKKTVSIPFNEKLTESEINFIIDKVRQYGWNISNWTDESFILL